MNAISTDLVSILKSLAQSLRVSSVFPATVFVWVNVLFVLPRFMSFDPAELPVVVLILTAILVLSYILYAFNAPLIRLAEGYSFQNETVGQILYERQKRKYRAYVSELRLCEENARKVARYQLHLILHCNMVDSEGIASHEGFQKLERWRQHWKMRAATAKRVLRYHYVYFENADHAEEREAAVIPTRLGNTIASFEKYPDTRYGIQAVTMWPRLVPTLQQENFIAFVEDEKTVFDFLLNMTFMSLILAVELGCLISLRSPVRGLLVLTVLTALAYMFYKAAEAGALNWGLTVRVAFDLYRGHLRKAFRIREPATLEEEREDWKSLSNFFIKGTAFDGFVYQQSAGSPSSRDRIGIWEWLFSLRSIVERLVDFLRHCVSRGILRCQRS
jgi:hypothetical protein